MLALPARRRWPKRLAYALFVGAMIGGGAFVWPLVTSPIHVAALPMIAPKTIARVSFEQPARLTIPKISVDAPVDQMGLAPDGTMQAPEGAHNVGWYKLGPRPGNKGVAVIAGHYGRWKNGATSVFDNLHKLRQGDRIHIVDTAGMAATFVVRDSRVYGSGRTVPEVFTAHDDGMHLNLITCQGKWDANRHTYTDRLVVFADKE